MSVQPIYHIELIARNEAKTEALLKEAELALIDTVKEFAEFGFGDRVNGRHEIVYKQAPADGGALAFNYLVKRGLARWADDEKKSIIFEKDGEQ